MCQICSFRYCPPACPSYRGVSREKGRPIGQCEDCGEYIYADERFFEVGRAIYCAECGENSDRRSK